MSYTYCYKINSHQMIRKGLKYTFKRVKLSIPMKIMYVFSCLDIFLDSTYQERLVGIYFHTSMIIGCKFTEIESLIGVLVSSLKKCLTLLGSTKNLVYMRECLFEAVYIWYQKVSDQSSVQSSGWQCMASGAAANWTWNTRFRDNGIDVHGLLET